MDPHEIAPGVIRIPVAITNAYLLDGGGGSWALVDAGLPGYAGKIRSAAEARYGAGARPTAIHLTHGHFDHTGALPELARAWEVPVYAHRLEFPYLTGESKYPPPDPTVGGFMAQLSRLFPSGTPTAPERLAELPEGEVPGLSGWEWLPTPGHSPGHVSFYRREDRTLIAGDAFVTMNQDSPWGVVSGQPTIYRPPNYYTCDWAQARESVRRLAELEPWTAATGHGHPMRGPEVAAQLTALAEQFPVPRQGRYVGHPAETDEHGIVSLPPPRPDPVPLTLAGVALVTLLGVGLSRSRRG